MANIKVFMDFFGQYIKEGDWAVYAYKTCSHNRLCKFSLDSKGYIRATHLLQSWGTSKSNGIIIPAPNTTSLRLLIGRPMRVSFSDRSRWFKYEPPEKYKQAYEAALMGHAEGVVMAGYTLEEFWRMHR